MFCTIRFPADLVDAWVVHRCINFKGHAFFICSNRFLKLSFPSPIDGQAENQRCPVVDHRWSLVGLAWTADGYYYPEHVAVVANFWARVLCCLATEDACFRMRITLGFVLISSLVCAKCVPGRLQSGSGVALNERVHEKVVKT